MIMTYYEWMSDKRGLQPEDILARSVPHECGTIGDFRQVVLGRLGNLAVLVLDLRLAGGETWSLVDCRAIGSPTLSEILWAVKGVRRLARDNQGSLGDPVLLRRIEVAMGEEAATLARRTAAIRRRRAGAVHTP